MNKPETEIIATHLQSIEVLLAQESPDLQHHIQSVFKNGRETSGPAPRGASIAHIYNVAMRKEDAKAILGVLTAAQKKHEWGYKVADFPLNLLVAEWTRICAAL